MPTRRDYFQYEPEDDDEDDYQPCPHCGRLRVADGMPFVYCPICGYCEHPASIVNDDGSCTCEVCEKTFTPQEVTA